MYAPPFFYSLLTLVLSPLPGLDIHMGAQRLYGCCWGERREEEARKSFGGEAVFLTKIWVLVFGFMVVVVVV
jgi:hypothetical protein